MACLSTNAAPRRWHARGRFARGIATAAGLWLAGCGGGADGPLSATPAPAPPADPAAVERVRPDLAFEQPVDLVFGPDGAAYLIEQAGRLYRFSLDGGDATLLLDLGDRVLSGGEQGLLGLALDPDFAGNGRLYVNYTAAGPRRTVIARYTLGPGRIDAASEAVILEVTQPFANHNAGGLAFGPDDGLLYIPLGDGGGAGDPEENGQDAGTLLGSLLRLDVSASQTGAPPGVANYSVPEDNPFVGNTQGRREEIWAYGFRNPFRLSFDVAPGGAVTLWLGDVGQDAREEVDQVFAGGNYGWNTREGTACFDPPVGCDSAGLTDPVAEYDHDVGRSITGGVVYRGARRPDLAGDYLYADFVSGALFALPADLGGPPRRLGTLEIAVPAFALDPAGTVYLLDYEGGGVYRLAGS